MHHDIRMAKAAAAIFGPTVCRRRLDGRTNRSSVIVDDVSQGLKAVFSENDDSVRSTQLKDSRRRRSPA
jgi:hypothetical protein